jgi:hypothetical protein
MLSAQSFAGGLVLVLVHVFPMSADTPGDRAVRVARTVLSAHLKAGEETFALVSVSPVTWRDSSLGCPEPGMVYTPALEAGHTVTLRSGDRSYEVHVAGGRGVICKEPQGDGKLSVRGVAAPARAAADTARVALATRLNVPAEDVRILRTRPAARVRDCAPDSAEDAGKGYVVEARVGDETYRYHVVGDQATDCSAGKTRR